MSMLNVFIDESGNFDFSPNGTKYFLLTAVSTADCSELFVDFFHLKHRIAVMGHDIKEFHATEDKQEVRNQVYDLIAKHCVHRCLRIHAIVVQKNKTSPSIRVEPVFYARMLRILLRSVFEGRSAEGVKQIVVWAARIGTRKKRATFEKEVKTYLAHQLTARPPYRILIHSSASHPMLQVADYCTAAGRSARSGRTGSSDRTP